MNHTEKIDKLEQLHCDYCDGAVLGCNANCGIRKDITEILGRPEVFSSVKYLDMISTTQLKAELRRRKSHE
ncbi:hypothetical protein HGB07_10195 [Candidatus Roizmanbacteria bacterium]|nr:hypothetical protein [Candidatus Roizmanbacteria bacterium]